MTYNYKYDKLTFVRKFCVDMFKVSYKIKNLL